MGKQNEPVWGIKDVWIGGDMESGTQRGGRGAREKYYTIFKKNAN